MITKVIITLVLIGMVAVGLSFEPSLRDQSAAIPAVAACVKEGYVDDPVSLGHYGCFAGADGTRARSRAY